MTTSKAKRKDILLTAEDRRRLPPLYSQESKGQEAVAYTKFFSPDSGWQWYAVEFDGEDLFYGLVIGQVKELGYFSLKELQSVKGPLGLPIERDLYFMPTKLSNLAPELFGAGS
jgi:hypothetical protein